MFLSMHSSCLIAESHSLGPDKDDLESYSLHSRIILLNFALDSMGPIIVLHQLMSNIIFYSQSDRIQTNMTT